MQGILARTGQTSCKAPPPARRPVHWQGWMCSWPHSRVAGAARLVPKRRVLEGDPACPEAGAGAVLRAPGDHVKPGCSLGSAAALSGPATCVVGALGWVCELAHGGWPVDGAET